MRSTSCALTRPSTPIEPPAPPRPWSKGQTCSNRSNLRRKACTAASSPKVPSLICCNRSFLIALTSAMAPAQSRRLCNAFATPRPTSWRSRRSARCTPRCSASGGLEDKLASGAVRTTSPLKGATDLLLRPPPKKPSTSHRCKGGAWPGRLRAQTDTTPARASNNQEAIVVGPKMGKAVFVRESASTESTSTAPPFLLGAANNSVLARECRAAEFLGLFALPTAKLLYTLKCMSVLPSGSPSHCSAAVPATP
mmetsp:Transcript_79309/g.201877  ORF Transcript_79309/g.201877 Transcript_79309/m.201877 type:complete len:252 (-) Transcript_79309:871-1626(-)